MLANLANNPYSPNFSPPKTHKLVCGIDSGLQFAKNKFAIAHFCLIRSPKLIIMV